MGRNTVCTKQTYLHSRKKYVNNDDEYNSIINDNNTDDDNNYYNNDDENNNQNYENDYKERITEHPFQQSNEQTFR